MKVLHCLQMFDYTFSSCERCLRKGKLPQPVSTKALELLKYDHLLKLVILGNSGVGKTSFLYQYTEGKFESEFVSTIGLDYRQKRMLYDGGKCNLRLLLQLWDTAGQERFRSLTTALYRSAMGFILMFDITNLKTFHEITDWISQLSTNADCRNPLEIVLIGNKCDLTQQRVVPTVEAQKLADCYGLVYFETSSYSGINVKAAVQNIVDRVMDRLKRSINDQDPLMKSFGLTENKVTVLRKQCNC